MWVGKANPSHVVPLSLTRLEKGRAKAAGTGDEPQRKSLPRGPYQTLPGLPEQPTPLSRPPPLADQAGREGRKRRQAGREGRLARHAWRSRSGTGRAGRCSLSP